MTPPNYTKKRYNQTRSLKKNQSLRSWKAKFEDYSGEKLHWLQIVLRLQGSVITPILPWLLFFSGYGFLIALLDYHKLHIPLPKIGKSVPNLVLSFNLILSLLLVFRTNTAYERYWEGRKLWGSLVNTVRNLTRGIWVVIEEREASDRAEKEVELRLVVAFAVAMKLHLRREPVNQELMKLLSSSQYSQLKETNHPPLEIAFWIGDYLQYQYKCNLINVDQLINLQKLVDNLVDLLGDCERILKTPMPLIYSVYLKQLLVIYCLVLPIELVSGLN